MSDITKTTILRVTLFMIGWLVIMVTSTLVNVCIGIAADYKENGHWVENYVFIIVTAKWLWGWLSRRVWIGSTPVSHS